MMRSAQADVVRLMQEGVALRAQGRHEAALELYQKAAALPRAPAEAFFNLGNVLLDLGRSEESAAALARALQLQPKLVAALMQLARCEVRLGRLKEADAHFDELLRIDPNHFSAWLEHGHLYRQLGEVDKMLEAYQRAACCTPQRWEGLLALTRSLEETGLWEMAAVHYQRTVALAGASAEQAASAERSNPIAPHSRLRQVHWRMARYRLERGDIARALEAMRQALMAARIEHSRHPIGADERAEMQIDLGDIQMRLGMTQEAHRSFERASAATSEATLVRLADLSFRYNLWQEAQAVLKRNVALHPQSATALWNLAHSYAESWQMDEALSTLAQAEAIEPQPGALSMRASVAGRTGDIETALRLYKTLADSEGPQSRMRSSAAMSSLYSDRLSAADVATLHRELFEPLGLGARSVESFSNAREPGKRLRVGLVTADFHHQHPVNIFMQPLLSRLDPKQFELTVYFTGVSYDDQTRLARSRVSHWVECTLWSDTQMARRIEHDGIDILLDLAGHTSLNRMSLFAQRAAPVQVTFLGYPASTGVPGMDWILADALVAPEESEGLYSERVYRLPNAVFCFSPEADYPYPAYGPKHAQRPLTFGSFNNAPKLTQHSLALWARVLQTVPGSRLLLKAPSFKDEGAVRAFKARFDALGIAANRLEFRGPVGLAEMMAEYADVDIALDTVPYNGGTTTMQALWMGVPAVVKTGHNFVSRMGASFMTAAGLPDWVARDDDDYVQVAARMAADRQALLALKRSLRKRLEAAPAWNVDGYTRDIEQALRFIWMDFCGKSPHRGGANP
jgi:predicted O-linked N-acetylglucosamine transferase (SPINDLY family)